MVFDSAWGVIHPPPHERNTAWNRGQKFFHCVGAPNNLICPWLHVPYRNYCAILYSNTTRLKNFCHHWLCHEVFVGHNKEKNNYRHNGWAKDHVATNIYHICDMLCVVYHMHQCHSSWYTGIAPRIIYFLWSREQRSYHGLLWDTKGSIK
jgi:hypothetical protein